MNSRPHACQADALLLESHSSPSLASSEMATGCPQPRSSERFLVLLRRVSLLPYWDHPFILPTENVKVIFHLQRVTLLCAPELKRRVTCEFSKEPILGTEAKNQNWVKVKKEKGRNHGLSSEKISGCWNVSPETLCWGLGPHDPVMGMLT
jgi:hypothetical protein